jgi:hypothetical protein
MTNSIITIITTIMDVLRNNSGGTRVYVISAHNDREGVTVALYAAIVHRSYYNTLRIY